MKWVLQIDGNFFMIRCLSVLNKDGTFMEKKRAEESDRQFQLRRNSDKNELIKNYCRHLSNQAKRYSYCSGIIIIKDGRSWRKDFKILEPKRYVNGKSEAYIEDIGGYKENRVKSDRTDWEAVYEIFEEFAKVMEKKYNIAYLTCKGAEGDDWLWYTPRYLKKNLNISSVLYCNDGDITQTIKDYIVIARQVRTKLGIDGELLTTNKLLEANNSLKNSTIFDVDNTQVAFLNEMFKEVKMGGVHHIVPNPASCLIEKILAGDKKDNIKAVSMYSTTGKTWKRPNNTFIIPYLKTKKICLTESSDDSDEIPLTFEHLEDEEFIRDLLVNAFAPKMLNSVKLEMDIEHAMEIYRNNYKLLKLSKNTIPDEVYNTMQSIISKKHEIIESCKLSDLNNSNALITSMSGSNVTINTFFDMFELPKKEEELPKVPNVLNSSEIELFNELGLMDD